MMSWLLVSCNSIHTIHLPPNVYSCHTPKPIIQILRNGVLRMTENYRISYHHVLVRNVYCPNV